MRDVILTPYDDYTRKPTAAVPRAGALTGRDLPAKFDLPGVAASGDHAADAKDSPQVTLDGITDVTSGFFGRVTHRVHAADNISFEIFPVETLALVDECGSGKSTVDKTLQ